jgi:hypothetical protein
VVGVVVVVWIVGSGIVLGRVRVHGALELAVELGGAVVLGTAVGCWMLLR